MWLDASPSDQGSRASNATRQHVIAGAVEVYKQVSEDGMMTYLAGSVSGNRVKGAIARLGVKRMTERGLAREEMATQSSLLARIAVSREL